MKVRDGQVTDRPVYVAIGVSCNGERDILGLWAGDGGEGAKFWLGVLTIKNSGVEDVCIVVCGDLKGLPDSSYCCWPLATRAGVRDSSAAQHLSGSPAARTGTPWPKTCDRSTPPPPSPQRWPGSRSSLSKLHPEIPVTSSRSDLWVPRGW